MDISVTHDGSPAASLVRADGLTGKEAQRRLAQFGANTMPDTTLHPWRRALDKFWAPVPWMLEATVVLELALGKYAEAAVIAGLLLFNAIIGLVQEGRAQQTLKALKSRLAMTASVRRDGAWTTRPAADLVPGDIIKLSLGGVVAADVFTLDLPLPALQTLSFVTMVFGGQAMIYAIRGRPHLWSIRPSLLLAGSTVIDVAIACVLAVAGIAMAPLSASVVAETLAASCVFAVVLDMVKWPVFMRLGIA